MAKNVYFVFLIAGIACVVWFLYERVKKVSIKATFLKAFASALFVCTACAATAVSIGSKHFTFDLFVIPGLVFGLLGDIWLDLKWDYPKDNDPFTFAGFGAFMLGHIIYITGLFVNYADFSKLVYIIVPFVLSVAIAAGVLLLAKPMKLHYGKFAVITGFYAFVLAFMTLLSGSLALMNGLKVTTLNVMFIGGVFFLISDLILSETYFGKGKNSPIEVISNHTTYYLAQFLIGSSLLFVQ